MCGKVSISSGISQTLHSAQVSSGDCPHLLFYGPPGAGKKTLIIGLLRQIYGPAVEKVPSPHHYLLTPQSHMHSAHLWTSQESKAIAMGLSLRRPPSVLSNIGDCRVHQCYMSMTQSTLCTTDQGRDKALEDCAAESQHRDRADHSAKQLPCRDEPQRCRKSGSPHCARGH